MKNILLVVSMLCFGCFTYAQSSTLSIVSETEPFILYLNGVNVVPMANTVAVVEGLKVGRNHVRLVFARKGVPELNAQLELVNDGRIHQLAYKVNKDANGKHVLKFSSDNSISILDKDSELEQQPIVSENSNAINDSNSANRTSSSKKGYVSATVQTSDVQVAVSQNGVSMNMNIPEEESSKSADKTDKSKNNRAPAVSDGLMCSSPTVDAQTLLKFKYKLSSVNMEMYKAKDIKEFMNKQCMLSAQVADLVKILQMNDYQYDVAQLGYLRTYDQANYGVVIDALMADFNKDKLLSFIGTNQTNLTVISTTDQPNGVNEMSSTSTPPKEFETYNANSSSSFSTACMPMEMNDFEESLEAVDDPIGEDNKLEVAKSVFDKECLSTNQVYQVVDLFIDEDKKLDFAKFAFSRTSDKDKYFRINKAFISEDRITELSNFIKRNR